MITIARNPERKFRFVTLTEGEFHQMDENSEGLCVRCGEIASCVEPDAERYACEGCDGRTVYGMSELLIMGRVRFEEEA